MQKKSALLLSLLTAATFSSTFATVKRTALQTTVRQLEELGEQTHTLRVAQAALPLLLFYAYHNQLVPYLNEKLQFKDSVVLSELGKAAIGVWALDYFKNDCKALLAAVVDFLRGEDEETVRTMDNDDVVERIKELLEELEQ